MSSLEFVPPIDTRLADELKAVGAAARRAGVLATTAARAAPPAAPPLGTLGGLRPPSPLHAVAATTTAARERAAAAAGDDTRIALQWAAVRYADRVADNDAAVAALSASLTASLVLRAGGAAPPTLPVPPAPAAARRAWWERGPHAADALAASRPALGVLAAVTTAAAQPRVVAAAGPSAGGPSADALVVQPAATFDGLALAAAAAASATLAPPAVPGFVLELRAQAAVRSATAAAASAAAEAAARAQADVDAPAAAAAAVATAASAAAAAAAAVVSPPPPSPQRAVAAAPATATAADADSPVARAAAKAAADAARFAPLTAEEEDLVYDAAISLSRPMDEVLIQRYGIPITRKHARRLGPGVWLNDEVANFYLELIKARHAARVAARAAEISAATAAGAPAPPPLGPVYIPSTVFFSKLTEDAKERGRVVEEGYCYANVQRWTRRLGASVFACEFCLVALNFDNSHWAVAIVRPRDRSITVYDSFGYSQRSREVSESLLRWLRDEAADKPLAGYDLRPEEWTHARPPPGAPRQTNGVDCGVFMLMAADDLSSGFEPDFEQAHIDHFRKRIMLAILRNGIAW